MLCRRPFIRTPNGLSVWNRLTNPDFKPHDGLPFPCGQCLACRINKRRAWTLRLLLEFFQHEKASFITLTYTDENLPLSLDGHSVLCKRDLQLFFKRLRKKFGEGIRYYACGEYGPKTKRPHYHCIIFGVAPDELDEDWFYFGGKSGPFKPNYCRSTPLYETWQLGIVHIGEVNQHSIQYCAGYVTKKITRKSDGLTPEFQLMSRRPGLGLSAVAEIARSLQTVSENCPSALPTREVVVDGKRWPLGRFLLHKLRIVSDIPDGFEEYYRNMQDAYRESKRQHRDFLEFIVESDSQPFLNLERKQKMFHDRGDL